MPAFFLYDSRLMFQGFSTICNWKETSAKKFFAVKIKHIKSEDE